MTSYIYLSDIHANYEALKQLKDLPEFNDPSCEFRFGGDYIDGYDLQPKATINTLHFIKEICDSGKAKAVVGNHDQFIIDPVYYPHRTNWWRMNGREQTLENLGIPYANDENLRELLLYHYYNELELLKSLPFYTIDGSNIMVHAGFDLDISLEQQNPNTMIWTRDPYIESTNYLTEVDLHPDFKNKTIITGHTPTKGISVDGKINDVCSIIKDEMKHNGSTILTRYFIDGGSKSGLESGRINLLKLDQNGSELWSGYLNQEGVHYYWKNYQRSLNMKVKDIMSITDNNCETIIFVPSKNFDSDKQKPYSQSKKHTAIFDPRFYPHNPKMDTTNLEIKSIEPDIYQDDIPVLKIYTI